jgi:hypothetical protein
MGERGEGGGGGGEYRLGYNISHSEQAADLKPTLLETNAFVNVDAGRTFSVGCAPTLNQYFTRSKFNTTCLEALLSGKGSYLQGRKDRDTT